MSEMSSGLRILEMHERQTYLRERAHRESAGMPVDRNRRFLRRTRNEHPAT